MSKLEHQAGHGGLVQRKFGQVDIDPLAGLARGLEQVVTGASGVAGVVAPAWRNVDRCCNQLEHSEQQDEEGGHEDLARGSNGLTVLDEPVLPEQRPHERPGRTSLRQVLVGAIHELLLESHERGNNTLFGGDSDLVDEHFGNSASEDEHFAWSYSASEEEFTLDSA
ncbi:hypothetical protein ON010_g18602 [Phytophthora cinnamomi]|nr:hypothetical protein ON010_g18602 [Phytophthora cinnamomi]